MQAARCGYVATRHRISESVRSGDGRGDLDGGGGLSSLDQCKKL